jgi:hypothetical protein
MIFLQQDIILTLLGSRNADTGGVLSTIYMDLTVSPTGNHPFLWAVTDPGAGIGN